MRRQEPAPKKTAPKPSALKSVAGADGPARSRKEQKESTRERVRLAALELFSTVGFDETTTKAVAEKAGVAAGTVFVHARDKMDLLCLVMQDLLRDATERGFASVRKDDDLLTQLLCIFRSVLEMYGDNPRLALPFVRGLPSAAGPNGEVVNALTFEFLGRLAALVTEAQARGEIDPTVMPLLLAQNIFALYFFTLYSWMSGYATIESALDPQLKMSLELQIKGITVSDSRR
ncbi:MAG: TetR/AcrR family transcriptional regulator [Polyangiaceae bacterium]|nr:TetR/AcrR family transcriptional regulator [Polyangiaceae bacterium]